MCVCAREHRKSRTALYSNRNCTHPYLGIPNIVMPAETGLIGSCSAILAIVWFQLLSHVAPMSVLNAKLRSWF